MGLHFERDDNKAHLNLESHGVGFKATKREHNDYEENIPREIS
jgi:uncharacterized DUF497 family protein